MEVVVRVDSKVRYKEVVPKIRAAIVRCSFHIGMEDFLNDLEAEPTLVDKGEFGLPRPNLRDVGATVPRIRRTCCLHRWLRQCAQAS